MSSDQIPPPIANFTFPPEGKRLRFNYLDSFVFSWVTPSSSSSPCFFTLYFYNYSNPSVDWTPKLNNSVQLNDTKLVSLAIIDTAGLGQLNLDYTDPAGRRRRSIGQLFGIDHDPTQAEAVVWNREALASTSMSINPSTTSSALVVASSPSSPLADGRSHNLRAGDIAGIVLGIAIGLILMALLGTFTLQRRRRHRKSQQEPHNDWANPHPANVTQEKDAVTAPTELLSDHGRMELPVSGQ